MLGSLILYLKGMRICMFQLSGFYCKHKHCVRISLPYWASLCGGLYGISLYKNIGSYEGPYIRV